MERKNIVLLGLLSLVAAIPILGRSAQRLASGYFGLRDIEKEKAARSTRRRDPGETDSWAARYASDPHAGPERATVNKPR